MTSDGRSITPYDPLLHSKPAAHMTSAFSALVLQYSSFPGDCPPTTAHAGPKELFRLVVNTPPTQDDFRTCLELKKNLGADACLRCSLSTYSSQEHAERLKKDIPFFRRHRIASGVVPAHGGIMKRTTSRAGHWSWWPANGYQRHMTFVILS